MKNAGKAVTSIQANALCVVAKVEKPGEACAEAKPAAKKASKRIRESSAESSPKALSGETVGIDVGDRVSQFCRLDAGGEIAEQGRLHTNAASIEKHFAKLPVAVIVLEAGTQSGWIARLLRHFGHQVVVANPRDLAAVTSSKKKCDRNDAEKLARLARADLKLLNPTYVPTYVRSLESARAAIPLRAREGFVRARTQLVNVARSLAKIEGQRLPATITKSFGERALKELLRIPDRADHDSGLMAIGIPG